MFNEILDSFGINASECQVVPFGSGLINKTYKVTKGLNAFILQRINTDVFTDPYAIDRNLGLIQDYLHKHHTGYLFVAPLKNASGKSVIEASNGSFYRLFPFIEGSRTVNHLQHPHEAYNAAAQFGRFTRLLDSFEVGKLAYTLTDFHNLDLRYRQFQQALQDSLSNKQEQARDAIADAESNMHIVDTYKQIVNNKNFRLRVVHHDTKINNVLFDEEGNALCLVDLDTVMPGYYMSDVGDMMRTYIAAADEEEQDLDRIKVRKEFLKEIYAGYMSEMGDILHEEEKEQFLYSGEMMIYMQALRFLTDFLNNDTYYGARYEGHNLTRARNQFRLLKEYQAATHNLDFLVKDLAL
ncbi:hypothetical protein CKK33_15155 [Mucilaginibacter sp. MD40]|uniref:phosphotransferase enzyme family protein n=1 Tax=Mucilaginibacter sp. MD40 TaxID=2029590 RepID=UPI000BACB9A5|nr:aminoglycoside phosphotransferase family protein [Mucilaginibacter sp. MD40]PAW94760.1 hypothetical protein CKK33_15155 [Mucilaginibacter sp. MD40]